MVDLVAVGEIGVRDQCGENDEDRKRERRRPREQADGDERADDDLEAATNGVMIRGTGMPSRPK